jgi:CheY-like chemotaxis protein
MNAAIPNPEAARRRLLFVDDETLVLQGLKRSLHSMRAQWDMNFVESGGAALEALSRESYDAIITDMRMPVMDGAQLLEAVKEKYPEVVRMVLSGQPTAKPSCAPSDRRTSTSPSPVTRKNSRPASRRLSSCAIY